MKSLFIYIFIIFFLSTTSAQIDKAILEFDKEWVYQYEQIVLDFRVEGTQNVNSVEIELIAIEGKIDILNNRVTSGFSYDVINDIAIDFVDSEFTIMPLDSENVVLKVVVKDLYNNLTLESNILQIETKAQPAQDNPEPINRETVNLHLMNNEIYQGEEALLLVEVFSDDYVQNMEAIRLNNLPLEIKYMEESDKKEIYYQGIIGNLYTLPVMIYTDKIGIVNIPTQEITIDIKDKISNEVRTVTLFTNPIELVVIERPVESASNIVASQLSISLTRYPEKILKNEDFQFLVVIESDGSLDSISSLNNFFDGRTELSEKLVDRNKKYDGNKTTYILTFEYGMVSNSLVGISIPDLKIPYFNTSTGEESELIYEFPKIMGNIDAVMFWAFIFVVLGISVITSIFIVVYIKKNKGNKGKDLAIDDKNMSNFLTFVDKFNLTQREKDILKILIEGKSTKNIAETLYISPETAKKHINNIMKKTETHSRYEIYVLLNKYIST